MKKFLNLFNNSLKFLISLSIILCSSFSFVFETEYDQSIAPEYEFYNGVYYPDYSDFNSKKVFWQAALGACTAGLLAIISHRCTQNLAQQSEQRILKEIRSLKKSCNLQPQYRYGYSYGISFMEQCRIINTMCNGSWCYGSCSTYQGSCQYRFDFRRMECALRLMSC